MLLLSGITLNLFIFCLVLKTDEDFPILIFKECYLSVLFCDDTNVNTAILPKVHVI